MGRETLEPHELAEREDLEEPGSRALSTRIALTVGVLAVATSLASLEAERSVSESILAKNDAVLAQARASDEWAFRQAKSIKLHLAELPGAGGGDEAAARADIAASETRARADEAARDEADRRSAEAFERHHGFARATSLLQIAIVLETVAAVLRRRGMWLAGIGVGVLGAARIVLGLLG
jgi:uncharacterized protein DUF4337